MPLQQYILVEFGVPHVVDSLPDTRRMNRLAIIQRTWDHAHAFDSKSRYRWLIADPPNYRIFSRILAHTVYNPWVPVESEWLRCGEYRKSDLVSLVEHGLQHDDDVIQQWFSAAEVVRLMSAADDWEQMILAVHCICGAHELDEKARLYAERVLNREMPGLWRQ